jgi:hypothetical protein
MTPSKITFIITSVIYFPDKKLSYTDTRSAFTPEERTAQTLETIKSIRNKVPGVHVVLVEMGRKKNIDTSIISSIDRYIYTGNNLFVRWAAGSRYKGLGEAAGLLAASKKISQISTDIFFKISGRYFLNGDFTVNSWQGNQFFFRKYADGVSTRLYAFHGSLFRNWTKAIRKSLPLLYKGKSIEDVLPLFINQSLIKEIKPLGVSGTIGPSGEFFSE